MTNVSDSTMATSFPAPQPRGIDYSLPTCGETRCNDRGTCEMSVSGDMECVCHLGYQGQFCDDTVNGSLSLPLTLSVLAVIIGLVILAFILAKMRQKQRKSQRRNGDPSLL